MRISSISAIAYRGSPSGPGRPIVMPSRSTAWISDAGTPDASAKASSVRCAAVMSPSPRSAATAAARSSSAAPSPSITRAIAASDRPLPCRSRIRRIRSTWPLAVERHAALAFGRRDQAPRLVVADGVDRHVARRRDLLHAVPHESTLYESALERSAAARTARGTGLGCAGEARLPRDRAERRDRLHARDDGVRRGGQGPVRERRLGGRPPVPATGATPTSSP